MSIDGYTTIHRTTDLAQGELLAEMLRREGIDARFHKVSSTLIGLPASMIEMSVDVPAESEARARQLIADLEYAGAAEALDRDEGRSVGDEGEDTEAKGDTALASVAPRQPAPSSRRPIFAAAFAVFLPGGAHLYARRVWTALVLGTGVVASLTVVIAAPTRLAFEFAFAILLALVGCDAVGGVRAARADANGKHRPRGRQLARGLALLGIALAVGGGFQLAMAAPRLMRARRLASYEISCTDRSIIVQNRSGAPREIEISELRVITRSAVETEVFGVGIRAPRHLDLPAGGSGAVTPDIADWLARLCAFPTAPGAPRSANLQIKGLDAFEMPVPGSAYCGFSFIFEVREPNAGDARVLRGLGTCAPSRSPGTTRTGNLNPLR